MARLGVGVRFSKRARGVSAVRQPSVLEQPDRDLPNVSVSPVGDYEDLCAAFKLVHDRYVDSGYMEANISHKRYGALQLLPVSRTFIAREGGVIAGTATVVLDSRAGLPSGRLFKKEFAELRIQRRSIAEGTMFACQPTSDRVSREVIRQLMRSVFWWCNLIGLDDLCVVVNPKHLIFYQRMLGFEPLSGTKGCRYVKGAPGILLRLDLRSILEGTKELTSSARSIFISDCLQLSLDNGFELGEAEVSKLLLAQPDVFLNASEEQRACLRKRYPVAVSNLEGELIMEQGIAVGGSA